VIGPRSAAPVSMRFLPPRSSREETPCLFPTCRNRQSEFREPKIGGLAVRWGIHGQRRASAPSLSGVGERQARLVGGGIGFLNVPIRVVVVLWSTGVTIMGSRINRALQLLAEDQAVFTWAATPAIP
jgi:hypothetical protein